MDDLAVMARNARNCREEVEMHIIITFIASVDGGGWWLWSWAAGVKNIDLIL